MEKQFDLIVIGTGAAGSPVAHKCRQVGWSVAIIDSHPFGGTCALRGCDPKKVLVGAADVIDWSRRMQGKGVAASDARIDWPALMRFKTTFTDPVPENREKGYRDAGIAYFHGRARFVDKTKVRLGDDVLSSRFVHIAAGARPKTLGIDGEKYSMSCQIESILSAAAIFLLSSHTSPRERVRRCESFIAEHDRWKDSIPIWLITWCERLVMPESIFI